MKIHSILILAFIILQSCTQKEEVQEKNTSFYIGSYSPAGEPGIYTAMLSDSGKISEFKVLATAENPSFIAFSDDRQFLFSVNELAESEGTITAYKVLNGGDSLVPINQISSGGYYPCHITTQGKVGYVANYGGSVSKFSFDETGEIKNERTIPYEGSSVDSTRQNGPHAHSFFINPNGKWALSADLGADQLVSYQLSAFEDTTHVKVTPGAGPRHLVYASESRCYVINELNSTVSLFEINEEGKLNYISSTSTIPEGFEGANSTADIHLSSDGHYLYGSNRGHDSIVIFEIDKSNGALTLKGHFTEGINWPRNFNIDPSGHFMLVANQKGNDITVLKIDPNTGLLSTTGNSISLPSPVCIVF